MRRWKPARKDDPGREELPVGFAVALYYASTPLGSLEVQVETPGLGLADKAISAPSDGREGGIGRFSFVVLVKAISIS